MPMVEARNAAGDQLRFGERDEAIEAISKLGTPEEVVAAKWWFEVTEITMGEAILDHWWPVLVDGPEGPELDWETTGWMRFEKLHGTNPYM